MKIQLFEAGSKRFLEKRENWVGLLRSCSVSQSMQSNFPEEMASCLQVTAGSIRIHRYTCQTRNEAFCGHNSMVWIFKQTQWEEGEIWLTWTDSIVWVGRNVRSATQLFTRFTVSTVDLEIYINTRLCQPQKQPTQNIVMKFPTHFGLQFECNSSIKVETFNAAIFAADEDHKQRQT